MTRRRRRRIGRSASAPVKDTAAGNLYDEALETQASVVEGAVIPLRAERAVVERRTVCARVAKITRRAVSVRKTFEVDVVHEELVVEYEPGSGAVLDDGGPSESYAVLLHAEEVELVKRVRVVEEVLIGTRRVTEPGTVPVTLRHERLDVARELSGGAGSGEGTRERR